MDKKKKSKKQYSLSTIQDSFVQNMESLKVFVINISPIVKEQDAGLLNDTKEMLESFLELGGIDRKKLKLKNKTEVKLRFKNKEELKRAISFLKKIPKLPPNNSELLYKSSFVMLTGYFDFLISDLIRYFYKSYPESLSGRDLSIGLNELKLSTDLNDAISYIINKEVENVLYKNLDDQISYFRNNLKIDCRENIVNWNVIKEGVERRNIIIHNNSLINKRYLKNVDKVFLSGNESLKEAKRINVTQSYFLKIFYEIFIAGLIMIQCCWRKWQKENIDIADDYLNSTLFDLLSKENWFEAERLGLFAKTISAHDEASKLLLEINYLQALKWQNKHIELNKELDKIDFSNLDPFFLLGIYALKSDRINFYKNLNKAIITNKLSEESFMEWPIFREFRKDRGYKQKVAQAFRLLKK
ncbi:MAG: hypothetical protein WC543_05195 [Candidatus Omnitrophota bacterium]